MKTTVSQLDFQEAMKTYECGFDYNGSEALFNYFEELENDCGIEIELDPVAIRCEFTQYENLKEFHNDYDEEDYPDIEAIRDYTQVIEIDGTDGFIIQCF